MSVEKLTAIGPSSATSVAPSAGTVSITSGGPVVSKVNGAGRSVIGLPARSRMPSPMVTV